MLLLRYYLWIVPHLMCGVIAVLAFRKKLHKDYPAFVSLMAFCFLFELWVIWGLVLLWRSPYLHRQCLILDVVAGFLLQFLVLHELVGKLGISRTPLARLLPRFARRTSAVLILIAVLATALLPQTGQPQVVQVFVHLNLGLNFIAAGLLLGILSFARILNIGLPRLALGVALGIGITAVAEIATSPLVSLLGRSSYIALDLVRMTAFHASTVVWLIYILVPQNSRRTSSNSRLSGLELHVKELQQMVQR